MVNLWYLYDHLSVYCYTHTWLLCIGVIDHLHPVNASIWLYAMEKESVPTPSFFPRNFKVTADVILRNLLHITREDITAENCADIYTMLIENMWTY